MRILAIADDTTGALEVGGQLALSGVKALVTISKSLAVSGEAIVVDAQTRHMPAARAEAIVAGLAAVARQAGTPYVYKKTDSTLRGNIAVEFRALLDEFAGRPLIYVPAYPKMGRIVQKGELLVDGKPLAQTPTARDPLNPVCEGSIAALLSGKCDVSLASTAQDLRNLLGDASGNSVLVCDAGTDQDLAEAAAVIGSYERPCLVAGTGGFVGHWVSSLPIKRDYRAPPVRISRCFFVSGSRHPASLEQVRCADAAGIPTMNLSEHSERDEHTAKQLIAALNAGKWPVVATPGICKNHVGPRIGAIVRRVLEAEPVDCVVVFGGDTTLAILNALRITVLESRGELMAGIPLSIAADPGPPLIFVTKAGGFGKAETLIELKDLLEKHR